MASNRSEIGDILSDGTPIRSEEIGFATRELLACPRCSRTNSPERQDCIYCGESIFAATPDLFKNANVHPVEPWELGYNLVLTVDERIDPDLMQRLEKSAGLNADLLEKVKACRSAVAGRWLEISSRLKRSGSIRCSITNLGSEGPDDGRPVTGPVVESWITDRGSRMVDHGSAEHGRALGTQGSRTHPGLGRHR